LTQAQVSTIRTKLLKIGAQVRVTVRKVWVSMGFQLSGEMPGLGQTRLYGHFRALHEPTGALNDPRPGTRTCRPSVD